MDSKDGFVRTWLDQMQAASKNLSTPPVEGACEFHTTVGLPWRPHGMLPPLVIKDRHPRDLSSEVLSLPSSPLFIRSSPTSRQCRPNDQGSAGPGASDAVNRVHIKELENRKFEKRPRRKTRPDKYDVQNPHRTAEISGKRADPVDMSVQRLRKKKLKSSREVMSRFSSAAILNDRVTTKPHLTTGLFLNGRQPQLQDPAFNDLRFVERDAPEDHPSRHIEKRQRLETDTRGFVSADKATLPSAETGNVENAPASPRQCKHSAPSLRSQSANTPINKTGDSTRNWPPCQAQDRALVTKQPHYPARRTVLLEGHGMQYGPRHTKDGPPLFAEVDGFADNSSEGPSSHSTALWKTGVFDYIAPGLDGNQLSPSPLPKCLVADQQFLSDPDEAGQANASTSNYQHKGVMVSPGLEHLRKPDLQDSSAGSLAKDHVKSPAPSHSSAKCSSSRGAVGQTATHGDELSTKQPARRYGLLPSANCEQGIMTTLPSSTNLLQELTMVCRTPQTQPTFDRVVPVGEGLQTVANCSDASVNIVEHFPRVQFKGQSRPDNIKWDDLGTIATFPHQAIAAQDSTSSKHYVHAHDVSHSCPPDAPLNSTSFPDEKRSEMMREYIERIENEVQGKYAAEELLLADANNREDNIFEDVLQGGDDCFLSHQQRHGRGHTQLTGKNEQSPDWPEAIQALDMKTFWRPNRFI